MSSKIAYLIALAFVMLLNLANSQAQLVTDVCLRCICEASSDCNQARGCYGDVCGLFRITRPYWIDGGKLTLNGEPAESPNAFENCVNDPYCAAASIQNYMVKFRQDCNGDNQVDCYDYAAIHKLGGNGCQGGITGRFATKFNQCLQAYNAEGK